jgi:hypothetical protein
VSAGSVSVGRIYMRKYQPERSSNAAEMTSLFTKNPHVTRLTIGYGGETNRIRMSRGQDDTNLSQTGCRRIVAPLQRVDLTPPRRRCPPQDAQLASQSAAARPAWRHMTARASICSPTRWQCALRYDVGASRSLFTTQKHTPSCYKASVRVRIVKKESKLDTLASTKRRSYLLNGDA